MMKSQSLTQIFQSIITQLRKVQGLLLWLATLFYAFTFIKNGILKFDPEGFWGPAFERWGFPVWFLFLVGFLETAGGVLIAIPRVRFFGAMTIAVVMFGALVTRLIHGMSWGDGIYIAFMSVSCLYIASLSNFERNDMS